MWGDKEYRDSSPSRCALQLREWRETIEDLVDEVVDCYHSGFAKAIHNYSQILDLFSESKLQVPAGHST